MVSDHKVDCRCQFCRKAAQGVLSDGAWDVLHHSHGDKTREPMSHPSGEWFWQVCPCGAKHLRIRE